jgi:RimJ/RimL family protein N-acetyltransferase
MLELKPFDKEFFNSLEDKDKIILDNLEFFHTIYFNEKKAGIVGIIKPNFVQIILKEEFRGKNLLSSVYDLLTQIYNLDELQATIDLDNIASIKAHRKVGFVEFKKDKIIQLRELKLLKPNQTRFTKTYIKNL